MVVRPLLASKPALPFLIGPAAAAFVPSRPSKQKRVGVPAHITAVSSRAPPNRPNTPFHPNGNIKLTTVVPTQAPYLLLRNSRYLSNTDVTHPRSSSCWSTTCAHSFPNQAGRPCRALLYVPRGVHLDLALGLMQLPSRQQTCVNFEHLTKPGEHHNKEGL